MHSVRSHSAAPGTGARQASLSVDFSRQEHWSGLPFPSPGDLPDRGSNLPLACAAQAGAFMFSVQAVRKAGKLEGKVPWAPAACIPEESPGACDSFFRIGPDGPAQRAVSVLGLGGLLPEERQGVSPLRWLGNLEVGLALCEARLGSSGLAPRPAFSPLSALLWRGSPVLFGYC